MLSLREISIALGGEISGSQVLAPGPGHSKADRSLAIWLSDSHDGFTCFSHAGDDWRACRDFIKQRLDIMPQWPPRQQSEPRPRPRVEPEVGNANTIRARTIFAETIDPRATVVEDYLARERGLPNALDDLTALTLRFHPRCPFGPRGNVEYAPAMIAAVRSARGAIGACSQLGDPDEIERRYLRDISQVTAIQRIRLSEDGKKIGKGLSLGNFGDDGVVFCGSVWVGFYEVKATIAEGIETALSMRALGFDGCVALAGAGRFRTFSPPFNWEDIVISAENDAASQAAWLSAGERWQAAGHHVNVWRPEDREIKDANDFLRRAAA